jgi:membrane-bound lytic murein transglycosylase F
MGIMQIMPGTWREETERLGIIASPFNPKVNIRVGVFYMKRMVRFWKAPRPDIERLYLAFASYNAGAGNILKAQTRCKGMPLWSDIAPCLQDVTGRHSKETITYVGRINRWFKQLLTGSQ